MTSPWSFAIVGDRIGLGNPVGKFLENESVGALAAIQPVVAGAACQIVAAIIAFQSIIAGAAAHRVVAAKPAHLVAAGIADQLVISRPPLDDDLDELLVAAVAICRQNEADARDIIFFSTALGSRGV